MPEYDNNNSGAMFVNDRKTTENQPDRTGSCEVNGVEYWVSGWVKTSKAGKPFMSLAFSAKDQAKADATAPAGVAPAAAAQPAADKIPF